MGGDASRGAAPAEASKPGFGSTNTGAGGASMTRGGVGATGAGACATTIASSESCVGAAFTALLTFVLFALFVLFVLSAPSSWMGIGAGSAFATALTVTGFPAVFFFVVVVVVFFFLSQSSRTKKVVFSLIRIRIQIQILVVQSSSLQNLNHRHHRLKTSRASFSTGAYRVSLVSRVCLVGQKSC